MEQSRTEFDQQVINAIDAKTKPIGSLGRVEGLAAQIARIQGTMTPKAETCSLTIFAADHGMAKAGVSAFPQAVTRQMVLNFLNGGAAANVFAKSVGAEIQVVDAGVAGEPIVHNDLINRRLGLGTANAIAGPAMTVTQLDECLSHGHQIGAAIAADVACFGEMGIGNTSSATLLVAKLLGQSTTELTGRGTGLSDAGLAQKAALLEQAASRTAESLGALEALTEYGGFEIAMMAGAMIASAESARVVVIDGFIASAAALSAKDLAPGCERNFVFAHRSAEAGHSRILQAFGAEPLLDLDMRLGEGTGALLAFPLIKAAAAMLSDMASFTSAGISERL